MTHLLRTVGTQDQWSSWRCFQTNAFQWSPAQTQREETGRTPSLISRSLRSSSCALSSREPLAVLCWFGACARSIATWNESVVALSRLPLLLRTLLQCWFRLFVRLSSQWWDLQSLWSQLWRGVRSVFLFRPGKWGGKSYSEDVGGEGIAFFRSLVHGLNLENDSLFEFLNLLSAAHLGKIFTFILLKSE